MSARHRHLARALAAILAGVALLAAPGSPVGSGAALASTTFTFCQDGLYSLKVFDYGPAGTTETFRVTSSPSGHLGFSLSTSGPFTDPLDVTITFNSSGYGEREFFAKGLSVGVTDIFATSLLDGEETVAVSATVDRVETLTVRPTDPGKSLDSDPNAPSGTNGKRFFPDRDTPGGDAVNARRLTLEATLALGSSNVRVYFAFADVDDPSSSDTALDKTGDPAGNDNRGAVTFDGNTYAQTDASGAASLTLRTSVKPGDNYRFVASCVAGYMSTLRVSNLDVYESDGDRLPQPGARISDLLTVWRRLYIETDSMGQVYGNHVAGVVSETKNVRVRIGGVRIPSTRITIADVRDVDGNLVDLTGIPDDQFAGGRLQIGSTWYDIGMSDRGVPRTGTFRVYLLQQLANPQSLVGRDTEVVDDDQLNGNRDGDFGHDIPEPPLDKLQESGSAADNWLAPAYVLPVALSDHDTALPFRLQAPDDPSELYCKDRNDPCTPSFDHRADRGAGYWVTYLVAGYQPLRARDCDPASESGTSNSPGCQGGESDSPQSGMPLGAAVYLETAREMGLAVSGVCTPEAITVHELVHSLGVEHDSGTGFLMAAKCDTGSSQLSPASLGQLRGSAAWQ